MTRLFGRDGELARLRAFADPGLLARPRFVVVEGEAGIGKTSLAQALADTSPNRVRWAQGVEDAAPPYWLWRQLTPEILPDPAGDRFALLAALRNTLTADRGCLLVVDDVQWADEPSLLALRGVLRDPTCRGLVCCATRRTGEGGPGWERVGPELLSGPDVERIPAPGTRRGRDGRPPAGRGRARPRPGRADRGRPGQQREPAVPARARQAVRGRRGPRRRRPRRRGRRRDHPGAGPQAHTRDPAAPARGWRWLALAPLTFVAATPSVVVSVVTDGGIGGGAIAVPLFAMAGGYAVPGRGRGRSRLPAGLFALVPIVGWPVAAATIGGDALATPRGAWIALLFVSFVAVPALACAIPHRPVVRRTLGV